LHQPTKSTKSTSTESIAPSSSDLNVERQSNQNRQLVGENSNSTENQHLISVSNKMGEDSVGLEKLTFLVKCKNFVNKFGIRFAR
jgi:hypothetical protein